MNAKLPEMRDKVLSELSRIADWPKPQQSVLRMAYWMLRMKSLGKKAEKKQTAHEVLLKCIAEIQGRYPGYEFIYDKAFFRKA